MIAAKIKRKNDLTDETTNTSDAVNKLYSEASVTEALLRTFTSSQAESQLADARRDSEPENEVSTASPSLTLSPEMTLTERQKIMRRLDPETKQKVIQFGKGYTSEIEKRVYRDERGKVMQRPYKRTEKVIPDYVPGTDPGEHEFYSYPK